MGILQKKPWKNFTNLNLGFRTMTLSHSGTGSLIYYLVNQNFWITVVLWWFWGHLGTTFEIFFWWVGGKPTHPPKGLWEVTPVVLWWFWSDIINVTSEPLSKFFFRWVGGWKSHPPTHQKGFGRSHRWFFGGSEVISSMSPWNHFWNCFSVGGWVENHRPNHQQCFGPPTCQSTVRWQVTPMVLWWLGDIINVTSEPLSKFFFGGWGMGNPPTHPLKGFVGDDTGGYLVVLRWHHHCHFRNTLAT